MKTTDKIMLSDIRTGDIVEITGAYFKNDNGYYFVERSPGDHNWSSNGYCLKKISKKGKISKSKYSICFFPIMVTTNSYQKRLEATAWNNEHAEIYKRKIDNMSEVEAYFTEQLNDSENNYNEYIKHYRDNDAKQEEKTIEYFREIIKYIKS